MKDSIGGLKAKEDQIQTDNKNMTAQLDQLEANLNNLKIRLEEAALNKKTYEHMLERMKKDQTTNQKKSNNLEDELRREVHAHKHNQELLLQSKRNENDTKVALGRINTVVLFS